MQVLGVDDVGCLTLNSAGPARRGVDLRRFCRPPPSAGGSRVSASARPSSPAEWVKELPSFELAWNRLDLGNPMSTAGVSGANQSIVHRQQYSYAVDWDKVATATNATESTNDGFWKVQGISFNPDKYGRDDIRNHQNFSDFVSDSTESRMIKDASTDHSHEILYQYTYGTYLSIYRFDGSTAVPCATFGGNWGRPHYFPGPAEWPTSSGAPNVGMWLWQDADGETAVAMLFHCLSLLAEIPLR